MKEYHKIRWIYRFDEKTHLPIQEIDEYFVPLKDMKWIFTEKIDWTNIRVVWDWHKVEFYGRTDNAQLPSPLMNKLKDYFIEEIFEQNFQDMPVTLYGEWYWGKIQHWTRDYLDTEDFILFDVEIGWVYLERENVDGIATKLWLKSVPIILEWTLLDWINWVENLKIKVNQQSKEIMEWLVWTPVWWYLDRLWHRIIVKIKQEHFKTKI